MWGKDKIMLLSRGSWWPMRTFPCEEGTSKRSQRTWSNLSNIADDVQASASLPPELHWKPFHFLCFLVWAIAPAFLFRSWYHVLCPSTFLWRLHSIHSFFLITIHVTYMCRRLSWSCKAGWTPQLCRCSYDAQLFRLSYLNPTWL